MPGNRCTIAAWFSAILAMQLALASVAPDDIQRLLDQAAELNVTAPWHESQQVLEEIRPHLDGASEDQRGRFHILSARNQLIGGDMNAGLAMLEDLLATEPSLPIRLRALGLAANAAMLLRRYEAAFQHLGQALALLEQSGPDADGSSVFSLAAYIYAQVGQIDRALRFGHLAVEHAHRSSDQRGICTSHQRLAFVYKSNEDIDNARNHYQQALENCRATGDTVLIGVVTYGLADLQRHAGDQTGAAQLFEDAAVILADTGYRTGLAELALYRARLYRERDEWSRIESVLPDTALLFKRNEAWDYLAEVHGMLGEVAAMRGDYPAALEHFEAQISAREQFQNMDRGRQLAYLEVEFDTRFKEQELALLQEGARRNALQTQTYRQSRQMQYFAYIVAIALVLTLFLLLWRALRDRRRYLKASERDSLTGLYNHTRFFDLAERSFQLKRHQNQPYSLVLMDVDHFKQINDNYGHLAGDDALKQVGDWLIDTFSKHGIVGRIGGEEFAIALPDLDAESAANLVRTSYAAFAATSIDPDSPTLKASFGVAERTRERHLQSLRERADAALYRAKREGRDRVAYAE